MTPPIRAAVPSPDEFAAEVTAFFEGYGCPRAVRQGGWGEGDDDTSVFVEADPESERRELADARRFRAARYEANLGWITGPREFGGRELDRAYDLVYRTVAEKYETPSMRFFGIGLGMVAPTINAYGRDHIRRRYLPAMFRGDLVGCQLFSEPGAGSDVASVRTRAERTEDGWSISGQKVWTTGAHYSDIGLILVRTNAKAAKHRGLSMFLVDMRAPGVQVRPLRQMTGGASFNEVFFDDVRVADDHCLGDVGEGWRIAITTLANERASIGAEGEASARLEFLDYERLAALLRHRGVERDPVLRQQLARIYIAQRIAQWSARRTAERLLATGDPGPELSAAKLTRTINLRAVSDLVCDVLGDSIAADTGEWGTFQWTRFVLGVPGLRIAGGSDEIQRKIIGEQVLGLPR